VVELRRINGNITIGLLDLKAFSDEESITVKRDLERAGTVFLLRNLLKTTIFELRYTVENKPFLNNRHEHISISHSHDKLAIILNEKENTGIDIELIRDKVRNIQHKFLSEKEMRFANNEVEKLITLWAAKEALYKIYGLKEVDFSRHLFVEDFNGEKMKGGIKINKLEKNYLLVNETIDDYKMVYVLNEI
jgi:4'-phosphopantetheinyl transferase